MGCSIDLASQKIFLPLKMPSPPAVWILKVFLNLEGLVSVFIREHQCSQKGDIWEWLDHKGSDLMNRIIAGWMGGLLEGSRNFWRWDLLVASRLSGGHTLKGYILILVPLFLGYHEVSNFALQ